MAQRAAVTAVDDQLDPDAPCYLVVGDEEVLVDRAVAAITTMIRRADPEVVQSEVTGGALEGPELHELLGPSLFGDRKLLVIRASQDVRTAPLAILTPYLVDPAPATTIVLQHAGGAKGKALLKLVRDRGAPEIACAKLTRAEERAAFVRAEVRRAGGQIDADAVALLLDAVGSDLREIAAVSAQLVADGNGDVDVDLVRAYHRGRAEVSGFAVSDRAVVGDVAGALEALRFARQIGVAHVLLADALADGVRSVARVAAAGRGDPFKLAPKLGMPPWKVKRSMSQARGWSAVGLQCALGLVAELNADVKGAAADADFALERAVRALAAARAGG